MLQLDSDDEDGVLVAPPGRVRDVPAKRDMAYPVSGAEKRRKIAVAAAAAAAVVRRPQPESRSRQNGPPAAVQPRMSRFFAPVAAGHPRTAPPLRDPLREIQKARELDATRPMATDQPPPALKTRDPAPCAAPSTSLSAATRPSSAGRARRCWEMDDDDDFADGQRSCAPAAAAALREEEEEASTKKALLKQRRLLHRGLAAKRLEGADAAAKDDFDRLLVRLSKPPPRDTVFTVAPFAQACHEDAAAHGAADERPRVFPLRQLDHRRDFAGRTFDLVLVSLLFGGEMDAWGGGWSARRFIHRLSTVLGPAGGAKILGGGVPPGAFVAVWAPPPAVPPLILYLRGNGAPGTGFEYVENLAWVTMAANNTFLPNNGNAHDVGDGQPARERGIVPRVKHTLFIFRRKAANRVASGHIQLRHQRNPDVIFDMAAPFCSGAQGGPLFPARVFDMLETLLPQSSGRRLHLWAGSEPRAGWTNVTFDADDAVVEVL